MLDRSQWESPVGTVTLVSDESALIGVWIAGQRHFCAGISEPVRELETPVLWQAKRWLERYFAGEQPAPSELNMQPRGTEFQKRVWKLLLEIPYGEVTSYGTIAGRLAGESGTMSARAVGAAVGRNPISIVIPCHRVLGADGSLTGYAGGIELKRWLLCHEGVEL